MGHSFCTDLAFASHSLRFHFAFVQRSSRIHFSLITISLRNYIEFISHAVRIYYDSLHLEFITISFGSHGAFTSHSLRFHLAFIQHPSRIHFVFITISSSIHLAFISDLLRFHFAFIISRHLNKLLVPLKRIVYWINTPTYITARPTPTYFKVTLDSAVEAGTNKQMLMSQTVRCYKMPKSVIQKRVNGQRGVKSNTGGRLTASPIAVEAKIASYITIMEKWSFGTLFNRQRHSVLIEK